MSDAAAHATITLAQTKRLFESTAAARRAGAGAGAGGGQPRPRGSARGSELRGVRPRREA